MKRFLPYYIRSLDVRKNCADDVMSIPIPQTDNDHYYEVIIQRAKKTKRQERFFHALVDEISDFTGSPKYVVKYEIKRDTIGLEVYHDKKTDTLVTFVESSKPYNRDEYNKLIEGAFKMAADNGVILVDATRQGYEGILK